MCNIDGGVPHHSEEDMLYQPKKERVYFGKSAVM